MSEKTVMANEHAPGAEPSRSRWIVGAIILVLLALCCCLVVVLAWFFGDTLVGELSPLLQ